VIPRHAYIVVSKPDPAFAKPDTDWSETQNRSIHLDHHAALHAAKDLRRRVFERLSREGDEPEEYITRLLAYRKSIKIAVCQLEKTGVALVE
jgi:hypothetical protein